MRGTKMGLLAVAFMCVCGIARSAPIVYAVDINIRGLVLTGTITTDGTIGVLAPGDFLSWQFFVNGTLTFDSSIPGSAVYCAPAGCGDADAVSLEMTDGSYLEFASPVPDGFGTAVTFFPGCITLYPPSAGCPHRPAGGGVVPRITAPYPIGTVPGPGPFAYISNWRSNNVSVIDTATNTVVATVPVGTFPRGVAVNPVGAFAYVANEGTNDVSVISTSANTVVATVDVGVDAFGVAVNPAGTFVYVTNQGDNTVSVIDTATNTVVATVPVESPHGVAVNPAGTFVYVTDYSAIGNVSVIDTATNTVVATMPVGAYPWGVAVNPAGTFAYVTNEGSDNVSVIDTATNTVVATVPVGSLPDGVAVNPAGTFAYVANPANFPILGTVSVINTATNTVVATVPVGSAPRGVAVKPPGAFAYVANFGDNNVSVIDTTTNTVVTTVPVGFRPQAMGNFIGGETPSQATSNLITTVISLNFHQGVNFLRNVLLQINNGNTTLACNQLSAFIHQVQAQSGNQLTVATATQLIASAVQIKAALRCP